ncbi:MAG: TIR domain-containing protein [Candidatus Accumulibacter sp.]|jgi:tetratricopeptide (TPR) repeat protein|nr:TIR domain-containing protein [Accumulibacter sp.]
MVRVFLSYRRDDSAGWAGRLATDLQKRFGHEAVFQDIDAIEAGEDFVAAIERSLESCSAVLVVIGREWSLITDEKGARRLDNPDDTVRLEVARALARKDRLVIPVLVGGARMPTVDELPLELQALTRRNAFELSANRWEYDLDQLVAKLGPWWMRWRKALSGAVAALSVLLVAGYWYATLVKTSTSPIREFAITQPEEGQQLGLQPDQRWMVEGVLLLADEREATTNLPRVDIEVRKLPERHEIRQDAKTDVSTEGRPWRFDSATFAGEGKYEIKATVSVDGRIDYHTRTVTCVAKATSIRDAIEQSRAWRGVAAVSPVQLAPAELLTLKWQVYGLQEAFFELLADDLDAAKANARDTLDKLEPLLLSYPNDWELQNYRAYALKNYALVMSAQGRQDEFERALGEAATMFTVIRQQQPADPSAWNGLGSVALIRKDPGSALYYIKRALDISPNYAAALKDRETALQMLKQQEKADRP